MADLTSIFGGEWSPPSKPHVAPPEDQLKDAMARAGLTPPHQIHMDGKLHRFSSGTKGTGGHGDKAGWYVAYSDNIPAGRFGDWRSGIELTWRADIGREFSAAEEMIHVRRMAEAKALRDAEIAKKHETAANTVETIWSNCGAADAAHPYLKRKGIQAHGARITGDGRLVVPLFDLDGALSTLQYIDAEGGKLYHSGGQTGGRFWVVGTLDTDGPIYIAEGFATAATIHEVTSRPCVVAYSASNLVPVCGLMREQYGVGQILIVVADNDASGVGQRYAEQASAKFGARVVVPPEVGDANDYVQAGHDLLALLAPPQENWLIPADDFCAQPAPISWIVKHWVQEQALIMVHGPSGGGKTFAVLDWCLRIAGGVAEWAGNRVKAGKVVYLAGEGHHGLRGRVAAWKVHNQVGPLSMWLSRDGCDLNTPAGYQKVVESVGQINSKPDLIVVDTLHRFLNGDENSAQDAKTMLDACNALMKAFCCSVILVHHTGVSEEAQHRARGSSAWRGALDIEVSVVPAKGDQPMEIVQRKSKDAELAAPVYATLQSVKIPGWFDEDGEPVGSAVLAIADAPEPKKKTDSKLATHIKMFEAGWWDTGAELLDGCPYVTRSGLAEYLQVKQNYSPSTVNQHLKSSVPEKLIGSLTLGEIIAQKENGWVVICQNLASSMLLAKNG